MATIQLYFSIYKQALNNEWSKRLTSALMATTGVVQVTITEQNECSEAQVNVDYDYLTNSLADIERIILKSGAAVVTINIHFPSAITGVSDPYGASILSLNADEEIGQIEGVLGVAVSSSGTLKAEIAPAAENKNKIFHKIVQYVVGRKGDKS